MAETQAKTYAPAVGDMEVLSSIAYSGQQTGYSPGICTWLIVWL